MRRLRGNMRRFRMMGIALGVSLAAGALASSSASAQPEPQFAPLYDQYTAEVPPPGTAIVIAALHPTLTSNDSANPASITCSSGELDATLVKNGVSNDDDDALWGVVPWLGGTDGQVTTAYIIKGGRFSGCQASTPQGSAPVTVDLPPDPCLRAGSCSIFWLGALTSAGNNLVLGVPIQFTVTLQTSSGPVTATYQTLAVKSAFNLDGYPVTIKTANQKFLATRKSSSAVLGSSANLNASWTLTAAGDPLTYGPPATGPCDCAPS